MDNENNAQKPEHVPHIVFEAICDRMERTIKRLWVALIVAIFACVAITGGFLWYLNQYDYTSYEQDGEGVNIIGDSNGVDYNVSAGEKAHEEEPLNSKGQGNEEA